jgi:hypothetical protein
VKGNQKNKFKEISKIICLSEFFFQKTKQKNRKKDKDIVGKKK